MFNPKAALLWIATIFACTLFGIHLQAQSCNPDNSYIDFYSEANTISGTIKHCGLNLTCITTRTPPVADSTAPFSFAKHRKSLDNVYQVVHGVTAYNISNADNSTFSVDCDNSYGNADASTGAGSLLQGLVTWTSNDAPFNCVPNGDEAAVNCESPQIINGLTINGVAVPSGNYPAGAAFPVSGSIKDSDCAFGTETFEGSLVLQEAALQGNPTDNPRLAHTGMHLTGQATCTALGSVKLFTTQYDLKIGGSSDKGRLFWSPQTYISVGTLQLTSQIVQ